MLSTTSASSTSSGSTGSITGGSSVVVRGDVYLSSPHNTIITHY